MTTPPLNSIEMEIRKDRANYLSSVMRGYCCEDIEDMEPKQRNVQIENNQSQKSNNEHTTATATATSSASNDEVPDSDPKTSDSEPNGSDPTSDDFDTDKDEASEAEEDCAWDLEYEHFIFDSEEQASVAMSLARHVQEKIEGCDRSKHSTVNLYSYVFVSQSVS